MAELTIREHFDAPPQRVFEAVTDLERAADVISGIQGLDVLTDGAVGVGTRFRETRVMFGREAIEEMEVIAFEPPTRYVLEADSHGSRYVTEYRFEPTDGGTELTLRFAAHPHAVVARILGALSFLFMGSARKAFEADMADLKRAVEADRGVAKGR